MATRSAYNKQWLEANRDRVNDRNRRRRNDPNYTPYKREAAPKPAKVDPFDIAGKRFTMLVAIERRRGTGKWVCKCDCGNEKLVNYDKLVKAPRPIKSCGCLLASMRNRDGLTWDQRKALKAKTDPILKFTSTLRSRLYQAVRKNKVGSAIALLGCTVDEARAYLESLFQPGMTWENWSLRGWHIDHKRPLKSFDLTDSAQLAQACHYTNLQPLWAFDNYSKSDSY